MMKSFVQVQKMFLIEASNSARLYVELKVIFPDEATFLLNGHVNRQTCLYWDTGHTLDAKVCTRLICFGKV